MFNLINYVNSIKPSKCKKILKFEKSKSLLGIIIIEQYDINIML